MKKISHYAVITLLVTATLCVHYQGSAQCRPDSLNLDIEGVDIDVAWYIKPNGEIQQQRREFKNRFRKHPGNVKIDTTQSDTIRVSALVRDIYQKARGTMDTAQACRTSPCISGVRIIYGMEGKKIKLLYQPVYMQRKYPAPTALVKDTFKVEEVGQEFYNYNRTLDSFQQISSDPDNAYVRLYRDSIRIERREQVGADFRPFEFDKDARSIIFSFQEIIEFYDAIYGSGENDSTGFYCQSLVIHNGSSLYRNNTVPPVKLAKHTIFITDYSLAVNKRVGRRVLTQVSASDGANLAHLCPPSCSELGYMLEQSAQRKKKKTK